MKKDEFQAEFTSWYDGALKSVEVMKSKLKTQALNKGTYQKAINYLNKFEKPLAGRSPDNSQELWGLVVRQAVKEVKADIRDLALQREVKDDQLLMDIDGGTNNASNTCRGY
ncbi:hypothetical protein [Lactobacillus sp.]|uniref:hypothetical protein n=1 Tax=Lactobacillus sp. TaxID=1591 RepID=UPI0019CCB684|nr:hypothetical protein [Lactobacillus sp.]MBD5429323.1 hypothetical protein [Lactobacillus sp.]